MTEELSNARISAWLTFVDYIKPLWTGTPISGYSTHGPFHCGDCKYLKWRQTGLPFRDNNGMGRCEHKIVQIDPKVSIDEQGRKIVNIERGCCEFVDDSGIVQIIENPLLKEDNHASRH